MDASKTGKLIRELRTEKGLTQQELASLLGVSPTAVSKWENGRGLPDISMLEPLVKVLQVTFAEIILGERAAHEAAGTEAVMNKTEEPAKAAGAPADRCCPASCSEAGSPIRSAVSPGPSAATGWTPG